MRIARVSAMIMLLGVLAACGGPDNLPTATAPATTAATQTSPTQGAGSEPTAESSSTSGAQLKTVASFSILGDMVRSVGGERVEVTLLVPAESDAHTFEPSPAETAALAEAQLLFEVGLEFEVWMENLYISSGSSAQRVVLSEGLELLPAEEHEGEGEEHEGEGEEHGEFDPHIWQSVKNSMRMVERIREALVAADPHGAMAYQQNADAYLQQLKALDEYVASQAGSLPAERRKLVTTHDTFGYFARDYGFEIVGTALGSVTTETADPSAGEIVTLIEQIQAAGVPALFAENVQNSGLLEQLSAETGAKLAPPLYTDALGAPGTPGESYIGMMRYNIDTIVTALK